MLVMFAGCFIIYLVNISKLAITFPFAILVDVFANLQSARRDLSFSTLFVRQGLPVTALQGDPPLLEDPDLSYNVRISRERRSRGPSSSRINLNFPSWSSWVPDEVGAWLAMAGCTLESLGVELIKQYPGPEQVELNVAVPTWRRISSTKASSGPRTSNCSPDPLCALGRRGRPG